MGGRWVYRSSPDLRLDMPAAASLVRSLGGFYAYVKLFAAPGDLIVIDEPEMNAHPAAQLLLVEVFGMLVNTGVNILLTTHSPYIVDHVNNLTEAAELSQVRQEAVAKRFKLNNTKAFVPLEDVACYEFRDDGEVRPTIDRKDRVIDWSTFGRTSDQVTNLYADILKATRMEQSDAV
jgi:ABC-type multidrug transport system ATPase subunit